MTSWLASACSSMIGITQRRMQRCKSQFTRNLPVGRQRRSKGPLCVLGARRRSVVVNREKLFQKCLPKREGGYGGLVIST